MKSASAQLLALLHGGKQFFMADLYEITLITGAVIRRAAYDMNLTYNGILYPWKGPVFERTATRCVLGVEVDTMNLSIFPRDGDMLGSVSWPAAASRGDFDGATLVLHRVFMSSPGVVVGGFVHFSGRMSDVQSTRAQISVTVKSDLELLNVKLPRNLYQPGCMHSVFDVGCGLNKATFGVSGTVGAGSTAASLLCGLAQAAGYFDMGYVTFTSGALSGVSRTVKAYAPGVVGLLNPLPQAPGVGDTFTAYPGCDKTLGTCKTKFVNELQFRGFPFIPVNETAR